jgi:hypothetical protein
VGSARVRIETNYAQGRRGQFLQRGGLAEH